MVRVVVPVSRAPRSKVVVVSLVTAMFWSAPLPPVISPEVNVTAPTVLSKAPRSSVPPLTETTPGKALVRPSARVPALRVVPPVKVLSLLRVRVPPAPFIVSVEPPARMTSSATSLEAVAVKAVAVRVVPAPPVITPPE